VLSNFVGVMPFSLRFQTYVALMVTLAAAGAGSIVHHLYNIGGLMTTIGLFASLYVIVVVVFPIRRCTCSVERWLINRLSITVFLPLTLNYAIECIFKQFRRPKRI
jgi:hypothetical protein